MHCRTLLHSGIFVVFFVLWNPVANAGADLAREKRWHDELIDNIIVGEPRHLHTDGHPFLALYTKAETTPAKDAVIIMHTRGLHPD